MVRNITVDALHGGCAGDSFADGIRIDAELEPLAGPGAPVKPAVYEGGVYQEDRRWASPADSEPKPVIVIDNVPSQANRLEDALRHSRTATGVPEFVLDFADLSLPPHIPPRLSSLQFPHRNADAYLRDARLGDQDFIKAKVGQAIVGATAQTCGPLLAWFPQALLLGFWQSHLGKKRTNAKHARAWVSEIIGWVPAATKTRQRGLKGDSLNLSVEEAVLFNPDDAVDWQVAAEKKVGGKRERLSELGHGQVPFMRDDAPAAAVSFARISQRASVSFAQLRRVSLGRDRNDTADAAARALLVAIGLHAHVLAFGRGFALRSGAELRPKEVAVTWLSGDGDEECAPLEDGTTLALLQDAKGAARLAGVPLDGWDKEPTVLTPKPNLRAAIEATWPNLDEG